jgi:hypothetical protein
MSFYLYQQLGRCLTIVDYYLKPLPFLDELIMKVEEIPAIEPPLIVMDFSSLYPSMIIDYNLTSCFLTSIPMIREEDKAVKSSNIVNLPLLVESVQYNTRSSKKIRRYIKQRRDKKIKIQQPRKRNH